MDRRRFLLLTVGAAASAAIPAVVTEPKLLDGVLGRVEGVTFLEPVVMPDCDHFLDSYRYMLMAMRPYMLRTSVKSDGPRVDFNLEVIHPERIYRNWPRDSPEAEET